MTKSEFVASVRDAEQSGVISTPVAEAIIVAADTHERFGSAELGAIDWAGILAFIKQFLPVIAQVLPLIMAIFTPKQPPVVKPQPTPDIGVK